MTALHFSILLLVLIHTGQVQGNIDSFGLITEAETIKVAMSISSVQVSLQIKVGFDNVQLLAHALDVKNIMIRFSNLPFMKNDNSLANEFSIEPCKLNLKRTTSIIPNIFKHFQINGTEVNESVCKLEYVLFETTVVEKKIQALKEASAKILESWTVTDLATARQLQIAQFVNNLNEFCEELYTTSNNAIELLEVIKGLDFPSSMRANLEEVNCIPDSDFEKITVLTTSSSLEKVSVSLEVGIPEKVVHYKRLELVNYNGVELKLPNESICAKNNHKLYLLNCNEDIKFVKIPVCQAVPFDDKCGDSLLREQLESQIQYCTFTNRELRSVFTRIGENSEAVLIQGIGYTIADGDRIVAPYPPLIIYSPNTITMTKGSEEIKISNTQNAVTPRIIQSKLTGIQVTAIITKAFWNDFLENIDWFAYIDKAALVVQLIFAPFSFFSIIMAFRNCRRKVGEREKRKIKNRLQANERANRRLIETRNL